MRSEVIFAVTLANSEIKIDWLLELYGLPPVTRLPRVHYLTIDVTICQRTFWNTFSWMKKFWLTFHITLTIVGLSPYRFVCLTMRVWCWDRKIPGTIAQLPWLLLTRASLRYKDLLSRYGVPIIKIRGWWDRLFFIKGIRVLVGRHPYVETDPGPVSISEKTSFRKISWSLEAARFAFRVVVSLWNLTGTSAALLPMCLSNFKAIRQFKVPISWLRDFTRFYEKTSFRILRRGPGDVGYRGLCFLGGKSSTTSTITAPKGFKFAI